MSTASATRRRQRRRLMARYRFVYLMIIPVLIYFAVFSFYPLVLGVIQSFQKSKLIGAPEFVGLENYRFILKEKTFHQAFRNSLIMGLGSLILTLLVSVILTLGLHELRSKALRKTVQTATFLPFLFSWTVVGSIWVQILSNDGLVNGVLQALDQAAIPFMSRAKYARWIFILTAAWKGAGYNIVLLMASLIGADHSLYEAARMDGATRGQQMRHIMLPHMQGTIVTLFVLGVTGLLRNFDQPFVMGNSAILSEVRTLLYYIYDTGIRNFKVGYATAAATMVLVATVLLTRIGMYILKRMRISFY